MRWGVPINRRARFRTVSLIACLLTVAGSTGTSVQAATLIPACSTTNLTLGYGDRVSAMTGEHAAIYSLTNKGKVTCHLYGYPGVSFFDKKNRPILFKYTRAQSQYMAHKAATTVVLHSGARAFFLVAKYRCDVGDAITTAIIRVYPPNTRQQLAATALASNSRIDFAYCKGGIKDPGQRVDISPVMATPRFS